jgi:hypothetical protein
MGLTGTRSPRGRPDRAGGDELLPYDVWSDFAVIPKGHLAAARRPGHLLRDQEGDGEPGFRFDPLLVSSEALS